MTDKLKLALKRIVALDEAGGHELTVTHASEAVAIANEALATLSEDGDAEPVATEEWLRDTAMNVMLATEVEEAYRILKGATTSTPAEIDSGGDEKPRYTTKRLKQEIQRARDNDAREIERLKAELSELEAQLLAAWNAFGPSEKRSEPPAFDADDLDHLPISAHGDLAEQITMLEDRAEAAESLQAKGVAKVDVYDLAQEISQVDGSSCLGPSALAEALMPFLSTLSPTPPAVSEAVLNAAGEIICNDRYARIIAVIQTAESERRALEEGSGR